MYGILIKDLQIHAKHGVLDAEKELGQLFLVTIRCQICNERGIEDDLSCTVNYAEISELAEAFMKENTFDLIETCASELSKEILHKYPLIHGVYVEIKKPWAPLKKSLEYVASEISREWHTAYIGMGSNMGDKAANLEEALSRIKDGNIEVLQESSNYETRPVGYKDQDNFINKVICVRTLYSAHELLHVLLQIEDDMHRVREIHWGPRNIDMDLLLYDQEIINTSRLTVPHPRMHERLFVLVPLLEISPDLIHPLLKVPLKEVKDNLSKIQQI